MDWGLRTALSQLQSYHRAPPCSRSFTCLRSTSILNARYACSTRLRLSASAHTLLAVMEVPSRKLVTPPRNKPPIPRKKYTARSPTGDGASLEVTSGTSTYGSIVSLFSFLVLMVSEYKAYESRPTCLSIVENHLLRLIRCPEIVEPIPPKPAGSIRQEAAQPKPHDGVEGCLPRD